MRRFSRLASILFGLALASVHPCHAQTASFPGDRWIAWYLDTYAADHCGDDATGKEWRRALNALLSACVPAETDRQAVLAKLAAMSNPPPGSTLPPGMAEPNRSCRQWRSSTEISELMARLEQYRAGSIAWPTVVGLGDQLDANCDPVARAPAVKR
jgi:hypothetical protein